jgi:hypothetical protein
MWLQPETLVPFMENNEFTALVSINPHNSAMYLCSIAQPVAEAQSLQLYFISDFSFERGTRPVGRHQNWQHRNVRDIKLPDSMIRTFFSSQLYFKEEDGEMRWTSIEADARDRSLL